MTVVAVALLAVTLGFYCGHRYAMASRTVDAIIAASLDRLDLSPEDEAEKPAPCGCRSTAPWTGR